MTAGSKRVFVTGADGFIGSHLVEALALAGHQVRALAVYNSFGNIGWLEELDDAVRDSVEIVHGDVRDPEQMRRLSVGQDALLHLAALIAIPYSYQAPRSYLETNVAGTLNVLEAARDTGARVIVTSTSEVYGTARTLPITEDHPLQGQSPYSASKIAADKLAEAYALSFQLPVTVLRPFNTYGPRQSARAVIPTIIGQLLAAPESLQLGSLTPKRDLTFVTDTAAGFLRMLDADLVAGTTIHLGTGSMISIGDLVGVCQEILDTHVPIVEEQRRVRPEGSEVMALQSDPALAHALLNWQPTVSLRAGLAATIDWLRKRPVGSNPAAYQT